MRFEKRQFLDGTVEEVERAMLDPRYLDYLLQHHGVLLEVQALERKEEGPLVRRRVRYRLRSAPMKVAQQFLAALARDWDSPLNALKEHLDRGA